MNDKITIIVFETEAETFDLVAPNHIPFTAEFDRGTRQGVVEVYIPNKTVLALPYAVETQNLDNILNVLTESCLDYGEFRKLGCLEKAVLHNLDGMDIDQDCLEIWLSTNIAA